MPAILGQLLDARSRALVGRDRERAALIALVHDDRPLVAAVHGPARLTEVMRAGGFGTLRQMPENAIDLLLGARP